VGQQGRSDSRTRNRHGDGGEKTAQRRVGKSALDHLDDIHQKGRDGNRHHRGLRIQKLSGDGGRDGRKSHSGDAFDKCGEDNPEHGQGQTNRGEHR
jgi:hypothetical protein